jgi:DNA-binding transcriptional ArsR family regulator
MMKVMAIFGSMQVIGHPQFVYDQSLDTAVSRIAAAIGEPSRARMLYCLMDGHARTSTELAIVADASPSTASVHLHRLMTEQLVKVLVQGKHRYYSFHALGWLSIAYDLTRDGTNAFAALGIDLDATRALRRRFACACLDWSERRPYVGGALGAAILKLALKRKWVVQDLDSRALGVTALGRREMPARFGLQV